MAAVTEKASTHPLDQFLQLAKQAKGAAAAKLISDCLDAPGVYVFGELLDMPNIHELASGQHADAYKLLTIFAHGTYRDYKNTAGLPPLDSIQLKKLKHLTLVTMATTNKRLPYATLQLELDIQNVRELEDLIIEAIYADIVRGKLDQRGQQLEVDYAIGRDIRVEDIPDLVKILGEWCASCDATLKDINEQITKANKKKEAVKALKIKTEAEVQQIKRSLKAQQQQQMDIDDHMMMMDSHGSGFSGFGGGRRAPFKGKIGYAGSGSSRRQQLPK